MAACSLQRFVSRRRTEDSSLTDDDMRASVLVELPSSKGRLNRSQWHSRSQSPQRPLDALARLICARGASVTICEAALDTATRNEGLAATSAAAATKSSSRILRFGKFVSGPSRITAELSGARAGV